MRRFATLPMILCCATAALPCDVWWENCQPADGWYTGCFTVGHAYGMTRDDDCVGWVSYIGQPCIKAESEVCYDESPWFCGPDMPYPVSDPNSVIYTDRDQDHDIDLADLAWWQTWYTGIHWVVWEDDHWAEVE